MLRIILAILLYSQLATIYAADTWALPLFSTAPGQVFDTAHAFPPPPGADLYLVDLRVDIRIDEAGRITETRSGVYHVLTEAGVQSLAKVSEPWRVWRQNKPEIQYRIITPDKQAHVLDPATITEAGLPGANEMYMDLKVLQAPLPAIVPGSVVEFSKTLSDREVVMPAE
jgi:hypothetical protein